MNDTPAEFVKAYSEHIGHVIRYRDINQGTATYTGILIRAQWNKDKSVTELHIDERPSKIVTFDKYRGCITCETKVSSR